MGVPGIGGKPFDSGRLQKYRWTDRSSPANVALQGQANKPDYDFVNLGLLFPQNDPTEIAHIISQMDHRKALGEAIKLHIHFIQTSALVPVFKVQYKFYNQGAGVPGVFTELSTVDGNGPVFTWVSGSLAQIIPFPDIPAPTNENISANLDLKIFRDDNIVIGDVLVKYIDYHYPMDTDGSQGPFIK